MKKLSTLLFCLCSMVSLAQSNFTPVLKSTAFKQLLSKNNSLVFSKKQAANDAFLFLCGNDSDHFYFPDYRNHLQNFPNQNNVTFLETWDVQFIHESNSISDTSQFILCNSELLTPGIHTFQLNNIVQSNYHFNTNLQAISFDGGTSWNSLSNGEVTTTIPTNIEWFNVAVKYSVNGMTKKTGITFHVEAKSLLTPDNSPWAIDNSYQVDTLLGNNVIKGNAYKIGRAHV